VKNDVFHFDKELISLHSYHTV